MSFPSEEGHFRRLVEDAPIGIFESTSDGRFVWVNRSIARMLGFSSPDEVVDHYQSLADQFYIDSEDRRRLLSLLESDEVVGGYEFAAKDRYGEPLWLSVSAFVRREGASRSYRILGYLVDRTANRRLEELLRSTQEVYRQTVENSPNAIFCLDLDGSVTLLNASARRLFHADEEFIGRTLKDLGLMLPDGSELSDLLDRCSDGEVMANIEMLFRGADGATRHLLSRAYPIVDDDRIPNGCVFACTDVTNIIHMEQKLTRELRQKQLLLQEVHHRVKNNLQMVSSLLSLQSNYLENEADRERFVESTERIRSIAMVHEQLYLSEDLESVDVRSYLNALFADYRIHYPALAERVHFSLDVENVSMSLNQALPTALLVNELVNNAVKHAFEEGASGEIRVQFRRRDSEYLLEVRDNGRGLPQDVDPEDGSSLGLQIVRSLCLQLGGTVELEGEDGTCWNVSFPVETVEESIE